MSRQRNILLKIPAVIYGWGVGLRNFAFDVGILKSEKPSIPTICVGNLSVGGTGKTPHIELLIRLLRPHYKVAVLSRGYGRVGKEPLIAHPGSTATEIGDEPAQIMRKYPDLLMLIDGDRRRSIDTLEKLPAEDRPDVILMDDGFQHRYVKPAYSILLTPYDHPFTRDALLPYGNLREPAVGKIRADSVIVTGTPRGARPIDLRLIRGELNLLDHQDIYFSRVAYNAPEPLFDHSDITPDRNTPLYVIAGIANPDAFLDHVQTVYDNVVEVETFADHYMFRMADIQHMCEKLEADPSLVLLCTEKDSMRILTHSGIIPTKLKERFFRLPIHIDMSPETIRHILAHAHSAIENNGLGFR